MLNIIFLNFFLLFYIKDCRMYIIKIVFLIRFQLVIIITKFPGEIHSNNFMFLFKEFNIF
jgi:hypothetical protein